MFTWLPLDLLTVCAFAVACAAVGLIGLFAHLVVKRRQRGVVELSLFAGVAVLGGVGLVAGAPLCWVPCLGVVLLGACLALFRSAFVLSLGTFVQRLLSRAVVVWLGLFVVGVVTLVAQTLALEGQIVPEHTFEGVPTASIEESLQPVEAQWAVSDAGRVVKVFTIPETTDILPADGDVGFLTRSQLHLALIRTAAPDVRYNCHGFVFADGKYWVRGAFVEQILKDNGYHQTSGPQSGDIIVYRCNRTGEVAHTGVVRTVVEDTGTVLIESKLGSLGRFIHGSDKHPYDNTTGTYYHTSRGSHVLRGLDGVRRPGAAVLTGSVPATH